VAQNGLLDALGPLSVYLVTLLYCGKMFGWIKMPLCMEVHVGLDLGNITYGDQLPATEGGTAAPPTLFSLSMSIVDGLRYPMARR